MIRIARIALTALLAGTVSLPALAKAPCYTRAEAEAEQAIRLHTELMVVGLTCAEMNPAAGPSLFAQYKEFTLRHKDELGRWEKALIGHFKRHHKGNATRHFDSFRTRLANEMSQRAIALTTPVFCQSHVPMVARAGALTQADLRHLVSAEPAVRLTAAPRCEAPAKRVAANATNAAETAVAAAPPTGTTAQAR